jgi:hypothetical protein
VPKKNPTTKVGPQPLLVERSEALRLLGGISLSNALRLEKLGILKPVKLIDAQNAKTFYGYQNILDVAKGAAV